MKVASVNRVWIISTALVLAAFVRLTGVSPAVLPNENSAVAIATLLDRGDVSPQDLAQLASVERVVSLRLDRSAGVLLAPGIDGAPGQAGKDDDRDGVIDNALEMGAVGSDDQCVAPWSDDYPAAAQNVNSIQISKGAYVVDTDDDERANKRFIVYAPALNAKWAWTIVPSEQH